LLLTEIFLLFLQGLFGWGYMKYEHQREALADKPEGEPSLAEMTEVAIKMLKKSENGFFLMVEGGKIDVAHHDGWVRSKMLP
jgi:alkaline phosphatase